MKKEANVPASEMRARKREWVTLFIEVSDSRRTWRGFKALTGLLVAMAAEEVERDFRQVREYAFAVCVLIT